MSARAAASAVADAIFWIESLRAPPSVSVTVGFHTGSIQHVNYSAKIFPLTFIMPISLLPALPSIKAISEDIMQRIWS